MGNYAAPAVTGPRKLNIVRTPRRCDGPPMTRSHLTRRMTRRSGSTEPGRGFGFAACSRTAALVAALLCASSCGDDTTIAAHADLSAVADFAIGGMCPTVEPRSGDRCSV